MLYQGQCRLKAARLTPHKTEGRQFRARLKARLRYLTSYLRYGLPGYLGREGEFDPLLCLSYFTQ